MVMNIASALAAYRQPMQAGLTSGGGASDSGAASFSDTLKSFMGDAVKSLKDSEQATQAAATGKANLQEVVVAVSNAEVMMQTVSTIRDKIVSAYQEIMRTSI
jgi:flagellar hook-basal body complex protein FliE